MSDGARATTELYQQVILDHNRSPRNWGSLEHATHRAEGHNPLCGDRYVVELEVADDGTVAAVSFAGSGCAISKASASMMTEAVKGKTVAEAKQLFERFHDLVVGELDPASDEDGARVLGKLRVFTGIWEFPARVKCANLAWHTLHAALAEQTEPVTTE